MTRLIYRALLLLFVAGLLAGCREQPTGNSETEAEPPQPPVKEEAPIMIPTDQPRELTEEERKKVLDGILQARARQQAQGLGTGKVVVNGAWNYEGFSYLSPNPDAGIEARLVAVDVTISGHTPFFDIDDIEIVDGVSMVSYGSDPHAEMLTLDGKVMPADQMPANAPKASRWLLIYAFPKATPTFHLYYWGQQLTHSPVGIAESGMELPYPPSQ